jgi:hypothetical protein
MPVLAATSRLAPAIGRDLVEHRAGEIALRARADEWGQTGAELLGHLVAELVQAMMEVASICIPPHTGLDTGRPASPCSTQWPVLEAPIGLNIVAVSRAALRSTIVPADLIVPAVLADPGAGAGPTVEVATAVVAPITMSRSNVQRPGSRSPGRSPCHSPTITVISLGIAESTPITMPAPVGRGLAETATPPTPGHPTARAAHADHDARRWRWSSPRSR